MSFSPAIHKALLAGVARAPLGADVPLQDVLAGVPEPLRLWHLVAANDLWQRAGCALPHTPEQTPPCPAASTCPRAAERVLQLILQGIHSEQLASWLALARRHGVALPHGMLVALLELGMQKPALRADLAPLLGPRGHWLVAQHPEWSTHYGAAGPATPETHWQLGSASQRHAALQAMRRSDPAAALAALEADWASEPQEHRLPLLAQLAIGLGPADEAFLERVLDDKRKEVRTLAQQLLVALPGSQLVERCKARLHGIVGAPPALPLTLPEKCDKAMKRDGIGVDSYPGLGEKAGWLFDLMRNVPPAHWSAQWQLAPRQVLDLFAGHDFHDALLMGVVHACSRTFGAHRTQADSDWFVMLMSEALPPMPGQPITLLQRGMQHLPLPEQERIVLRWLDAPASGLRADTRALAWAEQRYIVSGEAMPLALSQRMLADVQRTMQALARPDYDDQRALASLGRILDPAILATAQANWPPPDWEHWPEWRDQVDKLMDTLQFRKTMQASFLEAKE
jgi:hypothetical protein